MFKTTCRRVSLLALLLGMSLLVSATVARPRGVVFVDFPEYRPATETSVQGTIVGLMSEHDWPDRWRRTNPAVMDDPRPNLTMLRMLGTHLLLDTGDGDIDVHVGPASFLDACDFRLEPGDVVTVVGSSISVDGRYVIVAREITRDGRTLTLRNEHGVAVWVSRRKPS